MWPPVTIDAKPEGSWTGPPDGPPSWLRPVPPTDPAKRPPASPPVAKSGAEAERQRQRANSDRSVEHKVMGSARMVQPDNLSSGFFWGGASGKRAFSRSCALGLPGGFWNSRGGEIFPNISVDTEITAIV
jgi:hypothetical protein